MYRHGRGSVRCGSGEGWECEGVEWWECICVTIAVFIPDHSLCW